MQKWIAFLGAMCSASVAVFVAYLLFEKKVNEEEEMKAIQQTTVKFKVPKAAIGTVIGRGGENIKRIQFETRCRCNFEDLIDENGCRYVVIRGTPEDVLEAQRVIKEIVDNEPITVEIKIPVDSVGYIIGRNGETIRHLCQMSGAKINVSRSKCDADYQSVTIKGSFVQIDIAKALINEKIVDSEKRKKRGVNNTISNNREFHPSSSSSDNDLPA